MFNIANKLLTRHSPFAPFCHVDEWIVSVQDSQSKVVCRRPILSISKQNKTMLLVCAHSWDNQLNTRRKIPCLQAIMYTIFYIIVIIIIVSTTIIISVTFTTIMIIIIVIVTTNLLTKETMEIPMEIIFCSLCVHISCWIYTIMYG